MAAQFRKLSLTVKSRNILTISDQAGNCNIELVTRTFCSSSAKFASISAKEKEDALETKSTDDNPIDKKKTKKMIDTTTNTNKREPSAWEKQMLIYGSRYNSKADIPPEVRLNVLLPTMDRIRINIAQYTMLVLTVGMLTIMYCGKRDQNFINERALKNSDGLWEAAEKKYEGHRVERTPPKL